VAWQFDSVSGEAYPYEFATTQTTANGQTTETITRDANMVPQPKLGADGKPMPYQISYPAADDKGNFLSHGNARSVLGVHKWGWIFVQATVAILILVGFESCTALGGEAKNAKRDIPIAVITSLLIQGAFCYLFEYFAANYFLNSGYTMMTAQGSAAPLGDMMIAVGDALFGGRGRAFMLIEAVTVFLALIGTTLSCINTGARVTYAMGKDQEVPEHFGILHEKNLSPHRAIWALAIISAVIGCIALLMPFGDAGAIADSSIQALPHGMWSSVWFASTHDHMAALPQSLLTVTLASNFGTFLLYGLSCVVCMVAYQGHPNFKTGRHFLIPLFGIVANLACMAFYIIGPFMGYGTVKEPLLALGVAAVWAIYGGVYFARSSKATGRATLIPSRGAGG
jgi:amino acid transporter